MSTYRVINNYIIDPTTEEDAKKIANKYFVKVGIWGHNNDVDTIVIRKDKVDIDPNRINIKGYQPAAQGGSDFIPDPLLWIDPEKDIDKYNDRTLGGEDMSERIDSVNLGNPLGAPSMSFANIKMTKDQWLKIGSTQGWIKNPKSIGMQKEAFEPFSMATLTTVLTVISLVSTAYPYVKAMFTGGDDEKLEELKEEVKQNPEKAQQTIQQFSQITAQAQQEISEIYKKIDPIVKDLRQKSKQMNLPCADMTVNACNEKIQSLEQLKAQFSSIESYTKNASVGKDPAYTCAALRFTLELEFCARSLAGATDQLAQGMSNAGVQIPGMSMSFA